MGTSQKTLRPKDWLTSIIENVLDFFFLDRHNAKVGFSVGKTFNIGSKDKPAPQKQIAVGSIAEMRKSLQVRCADLEKQCRNMYSDIQKQAVDYKKLRAELDKLRNVLNSLE